MKSRERERERERERRERERRERLGERRERDLEKLRMKHLFTDWYLIIHICKTQFRLDRTKFFRIGSDSRVFRVSVRIRIRIRIRV